MTCLVVIMNFIDDRIYITKFPQCNFQLEIPKLLIQNLMLSLTEHVWEFWNNILWDTYKHPLFQAIIFMRWQPNGVFHWATSLSPYFLMISIISGWTYLACYLGVTFKGHHSRLHYVAMDESHTNVNDIVALLIVLKIICISETSC